MTTKSKGAPRLGRITREKRWLMIHEAQGFKTGGLNDAQIVAELMKAHVGTTKPQARRLLAAAYADFDRDAKKRRRHQVGATLAGFDRTKRVALTAQRSLVVNGAIEKVSEPDGKLYLAALEAEAKLLGINAPERREVIVSTFDVVFADIASAMREEIVDPLPPAAELMRRLARRIRMAMEAGARTISSPKTVDAVVVTSPPLLSKTEELEGCAHFAPQSDGQNGHTNGAAPAP